MLRSSDEQTRLARCAEAQNAQGVGLKSAGQGRWLALRRLVVQQAHFSQKCMYDLP